MKKTTLLTAAAAMILGLSGCTDAEMAAVKKGMADAQKQQNTQRHGAVYFPEHGIICDKKSGFCADREGISIGFTKEYLGQASANKFSNLIKKHHMDTSSYTLSNGKYCDSNARKCYNNKWKESVDSYYTNMLFR